MDKHFRKQSREDIDSEIYLLAEALGRPQINDRENAKYRRHIEDAIKQLQKEYDRRC